MENDLYYRKYLKYKEKYLALKRLRKNNQKGGVIPDEYLEKILSIIKYIYSIEEKRSHLPKDKRHTYKVAVRSKLLCIMQLLPEIRQIDSGNNPLINMKHSLFEEIIELPNCRNIYDRVRKSCCDDMMELKQNGYNIIVEFLKNNYIHIDLTRKYEYIDKLYEEIIEMYEIINVDIMRVKNPERKWIDNGEEEYEEMSGIDEKSKKNKEITEDIDKIKRHSMVSELPVEQLKRQLSLEKSEGATQRLHNMEEAQRRLDEKKEQDHKKQLEEELEKTTLIFKRELQQQKQEEDRLSRMAEQLDTSKDKFEKKSNTPSSRSGSSNTPSSRSGSNVLVNLFKSSSPSRNVKSAIGLELQIPHSASDRTSRTTLPPPSPTTYGEVTIPVPTPTTHGAVASGTTKLQQFPIVRPEVHRAVSQSSDCDDDIMRRIDILAKETKKKVLSKNKEYDNLV